LYELLGSHVDCVALGDSELGTGLLPAEKDNQNQ
jgi:hypothetical protein